MGVLMPQERFVIEAAVPAGLPADVHGAGTQAEACRARRSRIVENRALAKLRGALERLPAARLAA
jgi:hypothetical protein